MTEGRIGLSPLKCYRGEMLDLRRGRRVEIRTPSRLWELILPECPTSNGGRPTLWGDGVSTRHSIGNLIVLGIITQNMFSCKHITNQAVKSIR